MPPCLVSETDGASFVSVTLVRRTGSDGRARRGAARASAAPAGAGACGVGSGARRRSGRRGRRRRGFVDADPVVRGQPGQSALVALSDGAELPAALPAIELAEDEGGLDGGVGAVEAGEFGSARRVQHPYVQPRDLAEGAAVGGGGDDDLVDLPLDAVQVGAQHVGDRGALRDSCPRAAPRRRHGRAGCRRRSRRRSGPCRRSAAAPTRPHRERPAPAASQARHVRMPQRPERWCPSASSCRSPSSV